MPTYKCRYPVGYLFFLFLCEEIKQNVIFLFLDYYYREDNNVKKERNDMKNVVKRFEQYLMEEEKSKGTIENYIRSVHMFIKWIGVKEHISRQAVIEWKTICKRKDIARLLSTRR